MDKVREVDSSIDRSPDNKNIDAKIEMLLKQKQQKIAESHAEMCERILDLNNFLARLNAISDGDEQTLDQIAKSCTNKMLKRQSAPKKCDAEICCISKFDVDAKRDDWVQCDQCEQWYHMMCQALSDLDSFISAKQQIMLYYEQLRDLVAQKNEISDTYSSIRQD